ncbi:MAG: hypothetical protein MZV63_55195 [Marinilabiliales bacterium]|nr:hypothetical protein [Marinilabiliales bacterium]
MINQYPTFALNSISCPFNEERHGKRAEPGINVPHAQRSCATCVSAWRRFKKENKELLTYLLFESGDELSYVNR